MRDREERELSLAAAAELERYKYVLNQKSALNGRSFQFLSLYQALGTALSTAMIGLFAGWQTLHLNASIAFLSFLLLFALLVLLSIYVIASLVAGIMAWREYSKEEHSLRILLGVAEAGGSMKMSVWRWYESYMIALVLLFIVGAAAALVFIAAPQFSAHMP